MANIYVNYDTGNNSTGNGSAGNPYKSIDKAVTVGVKGTDTIISASSTNGQSWSNGADWGGFTIKGADIPNLQTSTYTMLDGVNNNNNRIDVDGGYDSTFENLYVKDAVPASALFDYTYSSGDVTITFKRCIFDNIKIKSDSNARSGLLGKFSSGQPGASSIEVIWDNCTFINIQGNSSGGWIVCPALVNPITVTFRNCTFSFDSSISVPLSTIAYGLSSYDRDVRFYNCIVDNRHATSLPAYNNALQDNLIFKNNDYRNIDISNGDNANNITSDPQFLDTSGKNFRLKTTSPARNIGDISL